MLSRPIHWLLYAGVWLLLGFYYTAWDMVSYHMSFRSVLPMNLCQNAVWALEGLVILRIARRHPIQSFSRASLPAWIINLGSGVLLALLGLVLAWLISLGFQAWEYRSMPAAKLLRGLLRFMFTYLHSTVILMWAVLGAFHGFLLYQGLRQREVEQARLETSLALARNQTLLAQFQPHFLFNALNSISSLIHSDPERADRMVARLGDLLRLNLEAEPTQEIPLERELALVDAYLAIEKIRFQDRLAVSVEVPPELAKARVPKFILQPLVENALKHGLGPRAEAGRLRIQAARAGQDLVLEVHDDGRGFREAREGVGLGNTRARLALLYKQAGRLEVFSLPDRGTRCIVRLPLH